MKGEGAKDSQSALYSACDNMGEQRERTHMKSKPRNRIPVETAGNSGKSLASQAEL